MTLSSKPTWHEGQRWQLQFLFYCLAGQVQCLLVERKLFEQNREVLKIEIQDYSNSQECVDRSSLNKNKDENSKIEY